MIQSSYKPIELPKKAPAPSKNDKPRDLESSKRAKDDFKKELKAVTESDEPKVKEVKVSADKELRSPSSIINEEAQTATPDSVSPKIFDPAMTKDVQNLIGPESAEVKTDAEIEMTDEMVMKLAQGEEVTDADLELQKQLGKVSGRSPAIDFAQAEIDPELLSMEDFVAQKNMVNKKAVPQNAYGMNPQENKIALENGLKNTQVVKDLAALNDQAAGSQPMNSQQFILNMQSEQKSGSANEVAAPMKTFDMSQIKTSNPDKIMTAITDYIVQAKAAKEPTVSMRMNHDQLGMIDITVSRVGHANADAVAINIGAHSMEGKNFFQQNSKDLFSHLSSAGINVSDMKVEVPSQTAKNEFDMNGQNQKGSGQERQFGSESNQRRHDSQKREDLWKLLNKEAA
jgi:hypothetical protein